MPVVAVVVVVAAAAAGVVFGQFSFSNSYFCFSSLFLTNIGGNLFLLKCAFKFKYTEQFIFAEDWLPINLLGHFVNMFLSNK